MMKNKVGICLFGAVCFFIAWCVWDQRATQKESYRLQYIDSLRQEDRDNELHGRPKRERNHYNKDMGVMDWE